MRHRRSVPAPGVSGRGARVAAAASVLVMGCCAGALVAALVGRSVAPVDPHEPPRALGRSTVDAAAAAPRLPESAPSPTPGESTAPSAAARPWRGVLADLDRRRARAYARADPRLLRTVYEPATSALRRDLALLRRYRRHGVRVAGLRMQVEDVRVQQQHRDGVVLAVRDRIAAGILVGAGRRHRLRPEALREYRIVLSHAPGRGWRISALRRADA